MKMLKTHFEENTKINKISKRFHYFSINGGATCQFDNNCFQQCL